MTLPAPTDRRLVRDLMKVGMPTCTPATPIHEITHMLLDLNVDEAVVLEEGHNIGAPGREELVRAAYARTMETRSHSKEIADTRPELVRLILVSQTCSG